MDSSHFISAEILLPERQSTSVLSEQYKTSYLFYVTLSFLCNIICYLISVFVFSLVTLSGATTLSPVSWAWKIHQLLLCKGVRLSPSKCPEYISIKPFDGEAPTLEFWVMWHTPSLPLLPGPLWNRVVAPDWVLSMGQIEQTVCKQMTDVKLWLWCCNSWSNLTVCKKELRLI